MATDIVKQEVDDHDVRMNRLVWTLSLGLCCLFVLLQAAVAPARAVDLLVLNTDDSGSGSLRQAVADAGDGATILFDSRLSGQTISLGRQWLWHADHHRPTRHAPASWSRL